MTSQAIAWPTRAGSWADDRVRAELAKADVEIDGNRPWDIRVNDRSFFRRVALDPALQLGETYVDGAWDCERLDLLFARLMRSGVAQSHEHGPTHALRTAFARIVNRQSRARATRVAEHHYDAGNDLFEAMLDPTMTYTCADFSSGARTLEEAQRTKLDAICRELELSPGDRLLDVGCGWGGLAQHAAENYGASVLGITVSREQLALGRERCAHLPGVELRFMDYRALAGSGLVFDKIASIEMIEAVGPRNLAAFFSIVHASLRPEGRFFLQSIVSNRSLQVCNAWFDRYIFPNGVSPSLAQLAVATEPVFGAHRWSRDIGPSYTPTLLAWSERLERAWPSLEAKHGPRFRRMFQFYLRSMAGVFAARHVRVHQQLYVRDRP